MEKKKTKTSAVCNVILVPFVLTVSNRNVDVLNRRNFRNALSVQLQEYTAHVDISLHLCTLKLPLGLIHKGWGKMGEK